MEPSQKRVTRCAFCRNWSRWTRLAARRYSFCSCHFFGCRVSLAVRVGDRYPTMQEVPSFGRVLPIVKENSAATTPPFNSARTTLHVQDHAFVNYIIVSCEALNCHWRLLYTLICSVGFMLHWQSQSRVSLLFIWRLAAWTLRKTKTHWTRIRKVQPPSVSLNPPKNCLLK